MEEENSKIVEEVNLKRKQIKDDIRFKSIKSY